MVATPAWPLRSAPRLFVDADLAPGAQLAVDGTSAHYLIHVMRVKDGAPVLLFNGRDGEWAAQAGEIRKRDLRLTCMEQTRLLENVPDLWLCLAPIRKGRIDLVAEKACELGVAQVRPVLTRRAVVDKLNPDRLRAHLIEAAEQCGRTAIPHLHPLEPLDALLRAWPQDRALFFADETGGQPLADALHAHPGPAAFLIGPEGGFDPEERAAIRVQAAAVPVSLGPRILRAETAAIAAMACWMAQNGDWNRVA